MHTGIIYTCLAAIFPLSPEMSPKGLLQPVRFCPAQTLLTCQTPLHLSHTSPLRQPSQCVPESTWACTPTLSVFAHGRLCRDCVQPSLLICPPTSLLLCVVHHSGHLLPHQATGLTAFWSSHMPAFNLCFHAYVHVTVGIYVCYPLPPHRVSLTY